MKAHFSFKFGHSANQSESVAELPTAMSSNSSLATHHPSSTSLASTSHYHNIHHNNKTTFSSNTNKNKSMAKSHGSDVNKASSSKKKIDFKDTKSLKSVKSESSSGSYFGLRGGGAGGVTTSTTSGEDIIKSNKSQKGSKSSGPQCTSLNKRYNEAVCRAGQSKPRNRFSLRNLLYSNPLRSNPFLTGGGVLGGTGSRGGSSGSRAGASGRQLQRDTADAGSEGSWMERESQATINSAHHNQDQASNGSGSGLRECVLCLAEYTSDQFPPLFNCSHQSCIVCLQQYVRIEVQEGRANLKCPQCSQLIHPNDIEYLIGEDTSLYGLYQFLMVRRVLAADPDTRWCPAPNCTYAVIAAGCASCPKIDCEREGCNSSFCYHCKAEWHPNITCDQARAKRHPIRSGSEDSGVNGGVEVKVCPRCSVLIVKMDDGSCNHMTCAVCGSEFCWLCMKEISDLHYLSPSGCTFWGKKPWSRKKKLLWQLGTIVGAPVGIALIAGISIPAMVIGIPVWVGRRIKSRHTFSSKPRRVTAIAAGVVSSVFVSPILAGLVVCVGVPCLLAYVYGVVPFSLCRSGGCGLSTTTQGVRIDVDEETPGYRKSQQQTEIRVANPSIGELSLGASLSMGSGSHLDRLAECDRESASNTAIAGYSLTGSVASSYLGQHRLEVGADVHPRKKFSFSSERLSETVSLSEKSATVSLGDDGGASTRALAGSILQYRMENTSVNSYKTGQATPGSSVSAGQDMEGVSYRPDTDQSLYPSGDEISVRSVPGFRSLSPVHGEDVSAALRRSRGRRILEKQQSETSGNEDVVSTGGGSRGGGEGSAGGSIHSEVNDRVRFDSHVSYLETTSSPEPCLVNTSSSSLVTTKFEPDNSSNSERSRLMIKKGDLDPETLREETAEELALVVSPLTPRGRSASPLNADAALSSSLFHYHSPTKESENLSINLGGFEMSDITCQSDENDFQETLKFDRTSTSESSELPSGENYLIENTSTQDQSNISLVQVEGPSCNNKSLLHGISTPVQNSSTSVQHNSTPIHHSSTPIHQSTRLEEDFGNNTPTFTSCLSQPDLECTDSTVYTTADNSLSINIPSSTLRK